MSYLNFPINQKLTKKFLMQLPSGTFLVSNCFRRLGPETLTPVFYENVLPLDDREAQWQRIKACGANHRLCHVYKDSEQYKQIRQFQSMLSKRGSKIVIIELGDK